MISFALDEDQQLIQETARKFARDVLRRNMRAFEQAGRVSAEAEAAFAELGLLQLDLEDGPAQPLLTAALVHEELAWGDPGAAVALWAPHLVAQALRELAAPEQRERLVDRFWRLRGGAPPLPRGAVAYAERWKSRLAGFATTAQPVRGGYSLSGTKSFVINAPLADLTLVFAQINPDAGWDGFGVFAVEGRAEDGAAGTFRLGDRHELLGLRAVPASELVFEEHVVPEENRLRGAESMSGAALRFFARAQLMTAARQVGLMRAAYELALEYTQERRAFGKTVAHFQSVAFTLADMLMDVESARWMVWRAAAAADAGQMDLGQCAAAAVHANEAAFRVADWCVQLLGGAGYVEDFPAEKWLREAKALALVAGTDQLHQQIGAAEALGLPLEVDPSAARAGVHHGLPSSSLQPFFT